MKTALKVLAVVLLGAGCATGRGPRLKDVKGDTAGGYYPLTVGNKWTYQVNYLGEQRTDTVVIEREDNGFFVDSHQSRLAVDAYGVRDDKRYLIREPVTAGTTWTNVVSVEAAEHYKIVSARASCEVPAGHFPDCVVVESRVRAPRDATLVNELTFAHGVGLVRVATVLEQGGRRLPQTKIELAAYHLASAAPAPAAK